MINAVISEFNPFHNGHKYLLEKAAKQTGAEATVCFMSGNFVQRGEPAISDKHSRAAIALENGADLIFQIPTAHSLSSAQIFARSGVTLADALGLPTTLCFGTETDDISPLFELAKSDKAELGSAFAKHIKEGMSYAAAAQNAYAEVSGVSAEILRSPNNLLAFEYIKAALEISSDMKIEGIRRVGTDHDANVTCGKYASASYIRNAKDVLDFVPALTPVRLDKDKYQSLLLFSLYTKTASDFESYAGISEGLENKFEKAAKSAKTIDELIELVKSKRYTRAKLMRATVSSFIEIPKKLALSEPPYLKVLGFNDKGRALLKKISKTAKLPIITKPVDAKAVSPLHFKLECRASDIYDYITAAPRGYGSECKMSPIYKSETE